MLKFLRLAIIILAITSCKNQTNKKEETATTPTEDNKSEWTYLFDGTNLEGWRGYNMDGFPDWGKFDKGHIALQNHGSDV